MSETTPRHPVVAFVHDLSFADLEVLHQHRPDREEWIGEIWMGLFRKHQLHRGRLSEASAQAAAKTVAMCEIMIAAAYRASRRSQPAYTCAVSEEVSHV